MTGTQQWCSTPPQQKGALVASAAGTPKVEKDSVSKTQQISTVKGGEVWRLHQLDSS